MLRSVFWTRIAMKESDTLLQQKKVVTSLIQQQSFYENFVLSSEVRIKEKEKKCSAVCNLSKEAL